VEQKAAEGETINEAILTQITVADFIESILSRADFNGSFKNADDFGDSDSEG
jgi:hypothetical protein